MMGSVWLLTCLILQGATGSADLRLIELAKRAVVAEVQRLPPPVCDSHSMAAPVFVTIEVKGQVRGCRGSLHALTSSLEQEIVQAARAASAHDPRYPPIQPADLTNFLVTVTIVDRTEPITSVVGLAPTDGLVLRSGDRTGIVLPLEGKDPETRLRWAYKKAGSPYGSERQIYRLVARRFRG